MKIPEEKLDVFKRLYKEHFGEELSDEEAQDKGGSLIRLIELVYRPTEQDRPE